MDFEAREEQVESITGVTRDDLEELGLDPEASRPDMDLDGWWVRASITDPRLEGFECFQVSEYTVITGRDE